MGQQTHIVDNQFDELTGYNLYDTDTALQAAVRHFGGSGEGLSPQGAELGTTEAYALAAAANAHEPDLRTFDARGRRIETVDFHPAWHHWLGLARRHGLHAHPLVETREGRWVDWAARFYLHAQVESGSQCPTAMTLGSLPLLQREPGLWSQLGAKLASTHYDPADRPMAQKQAIWIGMGMTEKQGGSDVRSIRTMATPEEGGGRGAAYRLTGHKWFFSAPMCDAHLVVAQTATEGIACFFVPRWRPDGTRNAVEIQRLKDKVGNRSNASSEVEFREAHGILVGEAGRGIPTIIEMATYTRLTCALSSAGFIRQAFVQGLAYARQRRAFGKALVEQPLMRSVLVDLMLESEGALALAMFLAQAYGSSDPQQAGWRRILTPAAKFWICKRAVELTGEAMEVFGGNGYVMESALARLFREAPVNSIWEGSGNIMCLDVLRAITRDPEAALGLLDHLATLAGDDATLRRESTALRDLLARPASEWEALGRVITGRLAILAQACLLRAIAPGTIAGAFAATRYRTGWGSVTGMIDTSGLDVESLLQRGFPA